MSRAQLEDCETRLGWRGELQAGSEAPFPAIGRMSKPHPAGEAVLSRGGEDEFLPHGPETGEADAEFALDAPGLVFLELAGLFFVFFRFHDGSTVNRQFRLRQEDIEDNSWQV